MQFAIVLSSKAVDPVAVEFMTAGWAAQAIEFCAAWGRDPIAVAFYRDIAQLPQDDIWPLDIVDNLDEPGASAYHSYTGNRPYAKLQADTVDAVSVEGSHEICETLGDETCDRWVARGDGTEVAAEVCDPVQGDTYHQDATVAGETRPVLLSNYVLPPYFDRTQTGPTNRMGLELAPFGIRTGGYQVVMGADGNEREVFGKRLAFAFGDHRGKNNAAAKLTRSDSRVFRRLVGGGRAL